MDGSGYYQDSWLERLQKGDTFKNWNISRPKLVKMWNANYGGTKREANLEQQSVEIFDETISSSKKVEPSRRYLRKRLALAVTIGMGSLISVLIPILVITLLPKTEVAESVAKVDAQVTIQNMQYTVALADKESPEYRNFSIQFCSAVEKQYKSSDLKDRYDGCVVTDVRNGSVIVLFTVVFVSQDPPIQNDIMSVLTSSKTTLNTTQVQVTLGVFILEEATIVVGTVTIIEAEENPVPRIDYNGTCSVTSSCKAEQAECISKRCACPSSRYYDAQSDYCFILGSIIGGRCSNTCSDNYTQCEESVCVCQSGYYNTEGTCRKVSTTTAETTSVEIETTVPNELTTKLTTAGKTSQASMTKLSVSSTPISTSVSTPIESVSSSANATMPTSISVKTTLTPLRSPSAIQTSTMRTTRTSTTVSETPGTTTETTSNLTTNVPTETTTSFTQQSTTSPWNKTVNPPTLQSPTPFTTTNKIITPTTPPPKSTTTVKATTILTTDAPTTTIATQKSSSLATETTTQSSNMSIKSTFFETVETTLTTSRITTSSTSQTTKQDTTVNPQTSLTLETPTLTTTTGMTTSLTTRTTSLSNMTTETTTSRAEISTPTTAQRTTTLLNMSTGTIPSQPEISTPTTTIKIKIPSTTQATQPDTTIKTNKSLTSETSILTTTTGLTSFVNTQVNTVLRNLSTETTTAQSEISMPTTTIETQIMSTTQTSKSDNIVKTNTSVTSETTTQTTVTDMTTLQTESLLPNMSAETTTSDTKMSMLTNSMDSNITSSTSTQKLDFTANSNSKEITTTSLTTQTTTHPPDISTESTPSDPEISTLNIVTKARSSSTSETLKSDTTDKPSTTTTEKTTSMLVFPTPVSSELTSSTSLTQSHTITTMVKNPLSKETQAQSTSQSTLLTNQISVSKTTKNTSFSLTTNKQTPPTTADSTVQTIARTSTPRTTEKNMILSTPMSSTPNIMSNITTWLSTANSTVNVVDPSTLTTSTQILITESTRKQDENFMVNTTTLTSTQKTPSLKMPSINFNASSIIAIIGETSSFSCSVKNMPRTERISITRGDAKEPVVTAYANGTVEKYLPNFNATYSNQREEVQTIFVDFRALCGDEMEYYCESSGETTATVISVEIKPSVELKFPYELREGLWGLNIGCSATLGYPRGNLTMMRKLPNETRFSPFIPNVQKEAELRWNESPDSMHDCLMHVEYDFDTDLEGWDMTELRCAVNVGTSTEVLSGIGVFEIVPRTVCDNKLAGTSIPHPFNCKWYIICNNDETYWGYVHESNCNNDLCWLKGQECGTITTSSMTLPTVVTLTTPPSGTPYITFETTTYTAIIGETVSLKCYLKNITDEDSISITRGATKEPIVTVYANRSIEQVSNIFAVYEEESNELQMLTINFTVQCGDAGKYYCESSGLVGTANVILQKRPEIPLLTLSHDIVFGQEPWGDRPSKCEAEIGSPEGDLVVEVLINGSFVEYTGWWPLTSTSLETECGTYKTQPFVFYKNTTQYLNNKQIRCVVKSHNVFVNEDMPVSDAMMIRVVPSSYCEGVEWDLYEHPFECHAYINCKAGHTHFDLCAEETCLNHTTSVCDEYSCVHLCSREFTTSSSTVAPTHGTGPYIECNRTIEVGLGSDLTVHCMLGNVDASYITNVTIYKNEILFLSGGGTEGTVNDDVNKASVSYNASSLRLEITGLTCSHAGLYRVIVNDLLKDDVVIVVKTNAMKPEITTERFIRNQQASIKCRGSLGNPLGIRDVHILKRLAGDPNFTEITDGIVNMIVFDDTNCTLIKTVEYIFTVTRAWANGTFKCVVNTESLVLESNVETVSLEEQKVFFTPDRPSAEVGESYFLTCIVSGAADLSNISIYHGGERLCEVDLNSITYYTPNITCTGRIIQGNGSLQVEFSHVRCTDEGEYSCVPNIEASTSKTTQLRVTMRPEKPNLTLSYDIVFGQGPWEDRPSTCEGHVGRLGGDFVVEILEDGIFSNYTYIQKGTLDVATTSCGTYKTLKFYFKKDTLDFLNNKQIRCAVTNAAEFDGENMTVSDVKTIRVVPANYCEANKDVLFYEHPFECHAFVNCQNAEPGNMHFKLCGDVTNCPNRVSGCDRTSCDTLCNREITTTSTTMVPTQGTDPYIECNRTVEGELGSELFVHCMLGNTDTSFIKNVTVYKNQRLFLSGSGTEGTVNDAVNRTSLTYNSSSVRLKITSLSCSQAGLYSVLVNELLREDIEVVVQTNAMKPEITTKRYIRNQQGNVKCKGRLGNPQETQDLKIMKRLEGDTQFTAVTDDISDVVVFDDSNCTFIKTLEYTFLVTNAWNNGKFKCITKTESGELESPTETVILMEQEVFFNQENSSVEIGRPFSMTCTVSGVRDLASIRLYHGEKLLCRLVIDMIIFNDPNITCKGSLGPSNGSLQIDFSLVRCSDEGEYSCVPNTEASTTKTTFLIVTREPTDPSFVTKPKSLVANTVMLNSEKFTCAAGVGYPAGQGQTVLQTNKDGIFKTFNLGEQSTTVSEDTCFINETLEVKAVTFEMSLNNTQLRCAFENDEGNTRYSEEYTIQLLQENYCEEHEEYSPHPFDCHEYVRCVSFNVYVFSCSRDYPVFVNGTFSHCLSNSNQCP